MSVETASSAALTAADSPLGQMLRGDPLAGALAKFRLRPAGVGLIVLAYGLVHGLLLPFLYGHLRTQAGVEGALDDWPYLVIMLVMVPLLAAYYAWQPRTIQAVFDGIGNLLGGSPAARRRVAELMRPLGWWGWVWLAGVVAAIQVVGFFNDLSRMTTPIWLTANQIMIASAQPLRFIGFYCIVFILIRQIITLVSLNRFFAEFSVEIAPLHPDRAGGLRVLGDYVLSGAGILAIVGLYFGMTLLRGQTNPEVLTPEYYTEVTFYLAAVPVVFVLPLWTVHARMEAAKGRLVAEVAEQFSQEYRVLLDNLRHNKLNPEDVARVEAVQKVYQIARASPEWPFDLEMMSKLGAAVFLPLLAPLGVDVLANLLAK